MREAQTRIDSREFAEWRAYYQLEPWGREMEILGRLAWMFWQVNRSGNGGPTEPEDFLPGVRGPEERRAGGLAGGVRSVEGMAALLSAAAGVG